MMSYKGYSAKIEYDDDADIFHGSVLNLLDVITFQGRSVDELKSEFATSVETYLKMCSDHGEEPEKPFSGKFVVRIEPDLHRAVALSAARDGKKMNTWIADLLKQTVCISSSHQSQDHADLGEMPTIVFTKTVTLQKAISLGQFEPRPKEEPFRPRFAMHRNRINPSIDRSEFLSVQEN